MTTVKIEDVLRDASISVLETMFFADVAPGETPVNHLDPVTCVVNCTGARSGVFTVAVDRLALHILCCAFYGDEDAKLPTQETEMICELTNMLAGSTLSSCVPEHFCTLSSPSICNFGRHLETCNQIDSEVQLGSIALSIEAGLLSVSCALRASR
jgi:CheY-specific phosphatase CheX